MKRDAHSGPSSAAGPRYWRSFKELADSPEARVRAEREFPADASEWMDPWSRRHFLEIMSASFLLAGLGLTGCRRPVEKIIPFARQPEDYVPGVPQYYATSMPARESAIPLLVRSNEGRPTKIEGNSAHPESCGAVHAFAQASILGLYDPDRARRFTHAGKTVSREAALDFLAALAAQYAANARGNAGSPAPVLPDCGGGQGLCVLLERNSSPSRARLIRLLRSRLPKARWFVHEPVDFDIHREAATLAYGRPVVPEYRLDAARVIVSLDADFLGSEPEFHLHIRRFAEGRRLVRPTDPINRLYVMEALFTLTGAQADHRLRLPPSQMLAAAAQLAVTVLRGTGVATELVDRLTELGGCLPEATVRQPWLVECARDLLAHRGGEAVVLAGYRQPLAVHAIAHVLNFALGAVGKVVRLRDAPVPEEESLAALASALAAGRVDTLVILGGNPVYNAPGSLDWARRQRQARVVVRLGDCEDETAAWSDWHMPRAHFLESWGDALTAGGTLVPIQPLIQPLHGGLTELEVLARIGGLEHPSPYEIVRDTFRGLAGEGEDRWRRFLHDGFLAVAPRSVAEVALNLEALTQTLREVVLQPIPESHRLELVFHRDAKVDDGRYSNNGWLQELPDPVTKMVWENAVLMSANTAAALGLAIRDQDDQNLRAPLVKVTLDGREIVGPAWIQPGMADFVLGLALGYGRVAAGRVGSGAGYDAYRLRTAGAGSTQAGATVTATGQWHRLATTQNHWSMEGRPIVREANLDAYRRNPRFARGMDRAEPPGPRDAEGRSRPLYPNPLDVPGRDGQLPREKTAHAWGMSIDLNACVGCSACVIACQSENNIPIVGKDLVSRNREMHWLRLDRYYAGPVEDPQMVTQPMLCVHCEAAPCESVCPVNATVHNEEGLNVMVYNRCVGTRYCSNNCPYKVRRFNFLDYHRRPLDQLQGPFYSSPLAHATGGEWDLVRWFKNPDRGQRPDDEWEMLKLAANPEVTVRMRGVMEKCTLCIQRIEQAKIAQKVQAGPSGEVEVPDGTIRTACQQACPAEAIVFGNLKDPHSRVSERKRSDRDYSPLEWLATKPRTTYLAKVRNPNPRMPDYREQPLTTVDWEHRGNRSQVHEAAATPASQAEGGVR